MIGIGEFRFDPGRGVLAGGGTETHLEPRVSDLLAYLAARPGEPVTRDELIETVWHGRPGADQSLTAAISKLRHALGDERESPLYIETVPKRGYRLVAPVKVPEDEESETRGSRRVGAFTALAVIALVTVGYFWGLPWFVGDAAKPPRVVVLPFENLGPKEQEYIATGLTEEITTRLALIGALQVISRTSAMRYPIGAKDTPTIADELGVDYILEGSIRWQQAPDEPERVRIAAQLIDADADEHVWAQSYDKGLTTSNIFDIQGEIALAVANALHANVAPNNQRRIKKRPTDNLEAYQAYLVGRQRMANRTTDGLTAAIEYFGKAVEIDPDFALAWVGLADSYTLYADYVLTGNEREQAISRARTAVERALELDSHLGEAHLTLGYWMDDPQEREENCRKVLSLSPNYATAYHWCAHTLSGGDIRRELELLQHARELDPLSPVITSRLIWTLSKLGYKDQAAALRQELIDIDPTLPMANADMGHSLYYGRGRLDEAYPWYLRASNLDTANAAPLFLAGLFLDLGDLEQVEYWVQALNDRNPGGFWTTLAYSFVHWARGEHQQSLTFAEEALAMEPPYRGADWIALYMARDHYLRLGDYETARALYQRAHPELLQDAELRLDPSNFRQAADLALVLMETGETERAEYLMDASLEVMQTIPRTAAVFFWTVYDAKIYAQRGEREKALAAFRAAVDEGWRYNWRYRAYGDVSLEPLREEPSFQTMVAELEADMATQLENIRQMEPDERLTDLYWFSGAY